MILSIVCLAHICVSSVVHTEYESDTSWLIFLLNYFASGYKAENGEKNIFIEITNIKGWYYDQKQEK